MSVAFNALLAPAAGTSVAAICAAGGAGLAGKRWISRWLIPGSGALLIGVALLVLVPELGAEIGWVVTLALAAAGFGLLSLVDRFAFPVCSSCDHHKHGGVLIEGLAGPLLIAVAIHAFVDGWGLVAVRQGAPGAAHSVILAILLHKIPEGLTLGALTRASFATTLAAMAWCLLAEMATLAGGWAGLWLAPGTWVSYALALAAGTFLFLGSGAIRATKHQPRGR